MTHPPTRRERRELERQPKRLAPPKPAKSSVPRWVIPCLAAFLVYIPELVATEDSEEPSEVIQNIGGLPGTRTPNPLIKSWIYRTMSLYIKNGNRLSNRDLTKNAIRSGSR